MNDRPTQNLNNDVLTFTATVKATIDVDLAATDAVDTEITDVTQNAECVAVDKCDPNPCQNVCNTNITRFLDNNSCML